MDTKFERVVVNISKKGSSWFGFSWQGNISSLTPLTPVEFLWFEDWLTWPKPAGMDVMMEIRMTSKNKEYVFFYRLAVPCLGSIARLTDPNCSITGWAGERFWVHANKGCKTRLITVKLCKAGKRARFDNLEDLPSVKGVGAADEKTLVENFGRVDHSPAWIMMNFGKLFAAVEKSGLWWGEGLCQVVWRPIRWL